MNTINEIWQTQIRLLTFRNVRPDLKNRFSAYLFYILFVTWLAGVGRYWDHPRAETWQCLGLGSLVYIFVLSLFLWIIILPLKPQNWTYSAVLVFVGLTALPALLYAVPVERFMDLAHAQKTNAVFLGIVAAWRVALYVKFLYSSAKLSIFRIIVATLLPLTAIVFVLSCLNLEHVVFEIMAGIREPDKSPHDTAYIIIFALGMLSSVTFPVTFILYLIAITASRFDTADEKT